jgi:hypothetical protein
MEEVGILQPLGQEEILPENEPNFPIPFLDLNSILRLEPVADDNDEGSLTPTTKTRKVPLSEVKVNTIDIEKYNETIQGKKTEIKHFLNQAIEKLKVRIASCETLVDLEKDNPKLLQACSASIPILKEELNSNEAKLNDIMESILIHEVGDEGIFSFATIYQLNISEADQVSDNLPVVLRYGLHSNSEFLQNLVGNYIQNGILHPCEKAIFLKAFEYLNSAEGTEQYLQTAIEGRVEYPRNVILVDIFDRSTNVINNGHNQTHTIALWKSNDNEIILIDPSMKSYSDHLLPELNQLVSSDDLKIKVFAVDQMYGVSIYPANNRITGYSNYEDANPKPRDCIDIAVKIAFEVNEQQRACNNFEQIRNNTKEQISNVKKNALYLNRFGEVVIRELQSSDYQVRSEAKNLLKEISNKFSAIGLQKQEELKAKNYQDIAVLKEIITLQDQITELKKQVVQTKNK